MDFQASEIQAKVRDEIQLELTEDQAEKLARFSSLLLRWNNAYNLTSIKNPEDVVRLHIADSLTLVQHFSDLVGDVKNVLDVGSGGGLPAIPLAIMRPDLRITMVDAVQKKTLFQKQACVTCRLSNVKVIERHVEKAKNNLKGSPIIVAGGYGVGSKENFDLLFDLAKELHAEVGASRAAVDAGFADHDRQIGQTGVTVRPKLYIACGISGQIQHIAGMQESGIIISINNDPDAPINTIADYVINGSIEEVVPKMIKYYKQNSK